MTEAQAVEAILQRWIDVWPTLQPSVPFAFEGEAFEAVTSYAVVMVQHGTRSMASLGPVGGRRVVVNGEIIVWLVTDVEIGRSSLALLADSVREVYEGQSIAVSGDPDPITTYGSVTREDGGDEAACRTVVTTGFSYYRVS